MSSSHDAKQFIIKVLAINNAEERLIHRHSSSSPWYINSNEIFLSLLKWHILCTKNLLVHHGDMFSTLGGLDVHRGDVMFCHWTFIMMTWCSTSVDLHVHHDDVVFFISGPACPSWRRDVLHHWTCMSIMMTWCSTSVDLHVHHGDVMFYISGPACPSWRRDVLQHWTCMSIMDTWSSTSVDLHVHHGDVMFYISGPACPSWRRDVLHQWTSMSIMETWCSASVDLHVHHGDVMFYISGPACPSWDMCSMSSTLAVYTWGSGVVSSTQRDLYVPHGDMCSTPGDGMSVKGTCPMHRMI